VSRPDPALRKKWNAILAAEGLASISTSWVAVKPEAEDDGDLVDEMRQAAIDAGVSVKYTNNA
jgi:hypothetical protein